MLWILATTVNRHLTVSIFDIVCVHVFGKLPVVCNFANCLATPFRDRSFRHDPFADVLSREMSAVNVYTSFARS